MSACYFVYAWEMHYLTTRLANAKVDPIICTSSNSQPRGCAKRECCEAGIMGNRDMHFIECSALQFREAFLVSPETCGSQLCPLGTLGLRRSFSGRKPMRWFMHFIETADESQWHSVT